VRGWALCAEGGGVDGRRGVRGGEWHEMDGGGGGCQQCCCLTDPQDKVGAGRQVRPFGGGGYVEFFGGGSAVLMPDKDLHKILGTDPGDR
jgi:hypothetical protein